MNVFHKTGAVRMNISSQLPFPKRKQRSGDTHVEQMGGNIHR